MNTTTLFLTGEDIEGTVADWERDGGRVLQVLQTWASPDSFEADRYIVVFEDPAISTDDGIDPTERLLGAIAARLNEISGELTALIGAVEAR